MSAKQKALLLMTLSTLSFSVMQIFVKLSSGSFHTMEQVFVRNFITLFFGAFMALRNHEPLLGKRENLPALLGRALLGYIGVVGYFYATTHMNVADASLLHRSSPFFVIIFSAIFLKNRLKRVQAAALLLAFAGSVLVINPGFDSDVSAAMVGVLSAAGAGGAYVIINHLKGRESNATIIFFFSAVSCLLSALMGFSEFVLPHGVQWLLLAGIGVFAALGQIFLTQAYKMSEPGEVSIMNYLGIVFSAILGFLFLDEQVGLRSLAGMAFIFTAALLLYFVKNSKPIGRAR